MLRFFSHAARVARSVLVPLQAVAPRQSDTFTFETPAGNQRNVSNLDDLIALAGEFPGQQKELFYKAYKCSNRFRDLVDNYAYNMSQAGIHSAALDRFIALAVAFPDQRKILFQLVLAQPNRMKELARDGSNISFLVAAFPAQRDKLFHLILTNVDHFKVLINSNIYVFKNICSIFPEKKEELCRLLLSDRDYFDATISNLTYLEELVGNCSNQRELLFQVTAENSVRFHNLVKKKYHLTRLAEIFPEHESLLNKPTIEEALHAIQAQFSKPEIEKNVDVLYEIGSVRPALRLTHELIVYIAAMTGDYAYYRNFASLFCTMAESRFQIIDQARLAKEATPSVLALIREHGLFMSVMRNNQQQPKTDQEQRSFDQQNALVVQNSNIFILS